MEALMASILGFLRGLRGRATSIAGLLVHGAYDTSTPEGRSSERYRRIALTALSFALMRGLGMILPIVTISFTLHYLGNEVYGLWITITSFFAFFAFADLGLGNGFLTLLSQAWGRDDVAAGRRLASTVFFLFLAITVLLVGVFGVAFPLAPWARILGARTQSAIHYSPILILAVVLPQLIQFPFTMVQRAQMALQEGYKGNFWQTGGALINFLVVILLVKIDAGATMLVTCSAAIPCAITLLNWTWFFLHSNRALTPSVGLIDSRIAKILLASGFGFLLLSILQTFGLMVDNLIVAHSCGLGEVAGFSIASRISATMGMAIGMISAPMWSANGEALARGDFHWVRRTTVRIVWMSLGLAVFSGSCMVAFGPHLLALWLKGSVAVPRSLLVGFALREVGLSIASPFFMVLNGAGRISSQVVMFLVFTPLATALKLLMAGPFGSRGVIWAMALTYLLLVVPWVMFKALRACSQPLVEA